MRALTRNQASALVMAATFATAFVACGNPVTNRTIDALGPEQPGVPRGPLHRAGQPCVTCHGPSGHATPAFSFAGTIYQSAAADSPPAAGVKVVVTDANGTEGAITTNQAGNFYVRQTTWNPVFPLRVRVLMGDNGDACCSQPPPPRATPCGTKEICDNGIDDDCDGTADCNDMTCFGQNGCPKDGPPAPPASCGPGGGDRCAPMYTHIGRDGSCADCHADPANTQQVGHVYVVASPMDYPQ